MSFSSSNKFSLGLLIASMLFLGSTNDLDAGGVLTGTVSGNIVEGPSKQPIPDVEVFLTNTRTGVARRTLSGANGEYMFVQVYPPGVYTLSAQKAGYRNVEYSDLQVAINDTTTPVPPIILEAIKETSSAVSIEGKSAIVNLTDSMRKLDLGAQAVTVLPVSGVRSFDRLALLAPGVFEVPAAEGTGPGVGPGVGSAGQFAVNGQRGRNNSFLVDGSDNNDQDVGVRRQGFIALVPQSADSIEQYQIISSNASAEFGRNSGAVANAVTKSGGNEVHGNLYYYFTHNKLNARNYFDQEGGFNFPKWQGGLSNWGENPSGRSPFQRQQYGATLGGPIVKNKTFWFASFEQLRIKDRPDRHFAVPTYEESSFLGYSPYWYKDRQGNSRNDLLEFFYFDLGMKMNGNIGRTIWNFVPLPNNPAGPFGGNTYTKRLNADGKGSIASLKIDQRIGENHTLTGRYNFTDDEAFIPTTGGGIASSVNASVRTQNLSLFFNSLLGANTTNQVRVSYGRTRLDFLEVEKSPFLFGSNALTETTDFEGDTWTLPSKGIQADFGKQNYGPFGFTGAMGQMIIRPYSSMGVDVYNFPQKRTNNTFQYADTVTYKLGRHILKAGGDIRRNQQNSRLDRNIRALAEFNNSITDFLYVDPDTGKSGTFTIPLLGRDLATLGFSSVTQTLSPDFDGNGIADFDTSIGLRFSEFNFFAQDDWKLAENFTLNYGVRYELNTSPSEVNHKIENTLQDPLAGIPKQDYASSTFDGMMAALTSLIDGRTQIFDTWTRSVAPRIGFAWNPFCDSKTTVRAGYGIFYDQNLTSVTSQSRNVFPRLIPINFSGFSAPIDGIFTNHPSFWTFTPDKEKIPYSDMLRAGTVNTIAVPGKYFNRFIASLSGLGGQGLAFTLPKKKMETPYAQHFHLTLEREIFSDTMVSAAYVGTRGLHLPRLRMPNGGIVGKTQLAIPGQNVLDYPTGRILSPRVREEARLGAYTQIENSAASKFDSLQLSAWRRFAKGLQFSGAYTWSHSRDYVSDVSDGLGFFILPQWDKNLQAEYGDSGFDVRHRAVFSSVWDLPWGGKNLLLGGWRLAGIFTAQGAQPYTVNTSFDMNSDGLYTDRLQNDYNITRSTQGPVQLILPKGAVDDGYPGTAGLLRASGLGNNGQVGRNTYRSRGIANLDCTVFKSFHFSEQANLEFRSEFFNVFNRTHFGIPIRILEAPGFGRSYNTQLNPRQIQLGLRLNF